MEADASRAVVAALVGKRKVHRGHVARRGGDKVVRSHRKRHVAVHGNVVVPEDDLFPPLRGKAGVVGRCASDKVGERFLGRAAKGRVDRLGGFEEHGVASEAVQVQEHLAGKGGGVASARVAAGHGSNRIGPLSLLGVHILLGQRHVSE